MTCPLGVVAGDGALPHDVCQTAAKAGRTPVVLYYGSCHKQSWYQRYTHDKIPIGNIGQAVAFFRAHHVREIVFAGTIQRPKLSALFPDKLGVKWFFAMSSSFGKDDALLRKIILLLEDQGFKVSSVLNFLPHQQVAAPQTHWGRPLSPQDHDDIQQGVALLKDLSPHDVGQAVVVSCGRILGIEAAEGTDGLLKRIGQQDKKGVLIKMAKTTQDLRADLPVVGTQTMKNLSERGLSGIAVQAEKVLLIVPQKIKIFAERESVFFTTVQSC